MSLQIITTSGTISQLTGIVTCILNTKNDGERHSAIFRIKAGNYSYRIVCKFGSISEPPSLHDIWHVSGQHEFDTQYGHQFVITKGVRLTIDSDTNQDLVCEYIIKNPAFAGIGNSWVAKLNNAFPENLVEILESINAITLTKHSKLKMPIVLAESLLRGWRHCRTEMKLIAFLNKKKIPHNLVHKLIQLLGSRTIECLKGDPYRLLAFMPTQNPIEQWRKIDQIALNHFAIKENDPRRTISAIEATLYQAYDSIGHTALPITEVQQVLNNHGIKHAVTNVVRKHGKTSLIIHQEQSLIQNLGHYALEKIVNKRLNGLVHSQYNQPLSFCNDLLYKYEERSKIKKSISEFTLDNTQAKAVKFVTESRLSIITGGGGTGKTTIISAIVYQHEYRKLRVWLLAPTGKAARRLTEETGHKAETVFSFILQMRKRIKTGELLQALIIIDEASMLDTPSAYEMLKLIPDSCRLCLVGDIKQLEPVGPGLVFHQLAANPNLCVPLSRPYRQNKVSDLHKLCDAIGRQDLTTAESVMYLYETFQEADVTWYPPTNASLTSMCNAGLNIWYEKRVEGKTLQLLAATRRVCQEINHNIQLIRNSKKKFPTKEIYGRNFIKGDPVIYEQNNKDLNISNGSVGEVTAIFNEPRTIESRECLIQIDFNEEGTKYLTETECLFLNLAYCITTHKSQGSQYDDVIIILDSEYLIDNSWLYTAASRARNSIVFIGEFQPIKEVIMSSPKSTRRHIGFNIVIKDN